MPGSSVVALRATTADAQPDDHDVPQRPLVIQGRKVEAVQPLIQPSTKPARIVGPLDDRAARRIDVEPCAVRVRVLHT